MSSLICFYPIKDSDKLFSENNSVEEFDQFLQSAFNQPRKKLSNNLKRYLFKVDQQKRIVELLEKRAQHASLDDFYFLYSNVLSS